MPVPTTTDELLELIRKSELIPAARLEGFLTELGNRGAPETPRALMAQLVTAGLITNFQAEQFLQGKWRGFTIGKYRVLERLGSGGMGTVYLCEHQMVGRKVAVKVLPTSQSHNPSALGRFYREGRAAGVLDHPNLVKAHDIDEDGGLHFLVMDYIDGASLQDIVSRHGPLSIARACLYIREAATGLQHAHTSGLVHRDVKPANIMVERNGNVRVLDLGLARFCTDDEDMLTLKYDEKNVLGTADYVAPEQALNSHEVDIRADIYSLGATFYYLLTGQPPFAGGKVAQKLIWHQVRQPTPVRQLRAEVPEEVAAIVARMMVKEPNQRYQTPQEVVDALAPLTRDPVAPPTAAEMPRLSPAAAPSMPSPPSRSLSQTILPPRRSAAGLGIRPMISEASGRVSTLHRAPPAAEMATPHHLARASTPTDTEQPRPVPPVTPSQLLGGSESLGGSLVNGAVFVLFSVAIGVGFTAWLLMR